MITAVIEHFDAAWNELAAPGSGFAMETIEVRGVPTRIFSAAPPHMGAIWDLAQLHGDKTYVVYEDERYTYAEIGLRVRALANWLTDRGVGRGDRVAAAMRNYPEWIVSYWAAVSLGAALVGLNAWSTPKELAYGLTDSAPKVLIADDERVERALPALAELAAAGTNIALVSVRSDRELPAGATRWDDLIAPALTDPGSVAPVPAVEIDPDDDVTIFYTSGTTGFPKGAQLTHRGSVHNLYDIVFMTMAAAMAEAKAAAAGEIVAKSGSGDSMPSVFMAPTPLFHVTACNCILHPATLVGGAVVLMYKWDAGRALELIEREKVTNFSGVPTMSREMLQHPDWATRDTSSLKGLGGGGAAIQPDLVDKIDKALEHGAPTTGYGLTETHGIVTANASYLYTHKPASCGRPVPVVDVKLIDEAGDDLAPGPAVLGELCVRGPIVIKGYLNQPDATAQAIRDGWFRTGDIARIDEDGFVFLVDRAKDMVLRGGENVYCSEVEAAIYEHPAIAQAAVFGIPDERLGETVAAALVLRSGTALSQSELCDFLGERIAAYKIPSTVWFRTDPLPVNANGKFLKRELKKELVGERA